VKVANKDTCSMDQQYWDSEEIDGAPATAREIESETHVETFYVAMKLALARLKEYSSATTG
jgi:hypothetical protein